MLQNYLTDIGWQWFAIPYGAVQTAILDTVVNQDTTVVLSTYLPILYGQVFNQKDTCPLPPKFKPRNVEITLQDNTKYKFDIPFNSSKSVDWSTLLNQLSVPTIRTWVIVGEEIPGYKIPLLLTKVP